MCTNCPFSTQTNRKQMSELLGIIDNVIAFKGKKINEIAITDKQHAMLYNALPQNEVELHNPMYRHGVLLRRN